MSLYELFKTIHVVAAIGWVGAGMFSQVLLIRAQLAGPAALAQLGGYLGYLGPRYFSPLSGVVLLAGIAMVIVSGLNFSDLWIIIGLVGFAATAVTGAVYLGPSAEKVSKLMTERGPEDPEVQSQLQRIFAISRIDLVVLILVVVNMVIKPGT